MDDDAAPAGGDPPSPVVLDLRGLKCPMPVLRARKALAALRVGAILEIHCTDPLAAIDIPHALHEAGDVLLGSARAGSTLSFTVRRGPRSGTSGADPSRTRRVSPD